MAGAAADDHHACSRGNDGAECRVKVPAADDDVAAVAVAGEEYENAKAAGRRRACCFCVPAARLFAWTAAPRDWALGVAMAAWLWLASRAAAARDGVAGFARTVWRVGADDPRKAVHGLKVALALTLCSVFYYVRPLYSFTGESAMWAVLTVVVVFEYTVGGCFYKGINRAMATVTGGALALGVQWVASKSGKDFEPYILTGSLFIFAAAATYSRFIPTMKARFDYGVTIFILTYTLVAVSGYRVDEVVALAQNRLTTIAIGAAICFAVCALVLPVWAGQELHSQVARNMDKLADAVEACVHDYFFSDEATTQVLSARASGYRAVLNAKASEDSLVNLATWEPAHGDFGFRHPYAMYQKVGAAMRRCAYSVDALAASVAAEVQAPARVKKTLAAACAALSRNCAVVLREASGSLESMTRSGHLVLLVDDMNAAAADLREQLTRLAVALEDDEPTEHEQSTAPTPLIEVLPLFTATSLLLEICARAEGVVGAVDALATAAKFKKADHKTVDVEAAVPVATTTITTTLAADAPQETHAKAAVDKEKATTDQAPRDQVGELIKVLMRRRSTKKWAPKVCPQPPLDFAAHVVPSPKSWSMELTTSHAQVVPSPKSWSMDLTAHPPVAPSPRHRSVDLAAGHPPVAPSPRHRAVAELAGGHPPIAPSPRHRAVDVAGHGAVVINSPRNRSMDLANHGPVAPSPRHRSILATA